MRHTGKSRFAIVLGNRGFFPAELILQARAELTEELQAMGHVVVMPDTSATKHGALSNNKDAKIYADFLEENKENYDGVILSLPNFGDESSAVNAIKEVDIASAIAMYALYLATGESTACLDWNNNYGDDKNKCILFHCGSTAQKLMQKKGEIVDHSMLQHDPQVGPGCSFGCNVGRIKAFPFSFANMTTQNGRLQFYLGQGEFTDDHIPAEFFGCGGVARIDNLQDVLLYVAKNGHRHHVSVAPGTDIIEPLNEALEYYLGYNVSLPQQGQVR